MGTISANAMVGRPPSGLAALIALLFTGCSPHAATSHYATLADAREERLFDKGWLPDILPASTTSIRTTNDIECSRSTGRFRMSPSDFAAFAAHSVDGAPAQAPLDDWAAVLAGYAADGLLPRTYRSGVYTWVFFCRADTGECQYVLW